MAEPEEEETTAFDAGAADDGDDAETEYDPEDLPQVLDLSGIEPTSYVPVPRGWYQGYVESVEYGLSQSKNLPMLTWILKFDYQGPEDEEPKERTLRWYTTLAGDGAGRTVASLAKLDPDLDLEHFEPEAMDDHFAGMDVMIQVTVRPDRDNRKVKRNNVSDVVPLEEEE